MNFKKGSSVEWKWLGRAVKGHVQSVYPRSIVKTIKGKTIKRKGTKENPAYLVVSEAGNKALKLKTELTAKKAQKKSTVTKKSQPKLFAN